MPSQSKLYPNPYGFFRPDDAAFEITNIRTPRPWVNVMSNDRYGLVLSQSGGGFSFFENCQLFRLSRWEQDLVQDAFGRYIYVQDLDDPTDLWSTTFQPTQKPAQVDKAIHGLGWSEFQREFKGLKTSQSMFIPPTVDAEIWIIKVENLTDQPRHLRFASYLEWHLGGIGDWHREFHRLFMESKSTGRALIAWKHANLREHKREPLEDPVRAVATWNGGENHRWVTDKLTWLGSNGTLTNPVGLHEEPGMSQTARWDDPIAAGLVDVTLPAGGSIELIFSLGAARGVQAIDALAQGFTVAEAKAHLQETKTYWTTRCAAMGVKTDDPDVDFLANTWLPYQAIAGRIYARCAYYQQGGAYGFRDQLQDSLMLLPSEPETTLLQLGRHAAAMFEDGSVRHWWHPATESWEASGPNSHHSDTCLWLAYGTLAYLDFTGDHSGLHQPYPYLSHTEDPSEGSLLDHCLRGIQRALNRRSSRGLPLIGAGDWNDGLSHVGLDGIGESVWLAMFLFDILRRMAPVLRSEGQPELAENFEMEAESLRIAVNEHAWDGEWYLAGTRDDGQPFGSHTNKEGRIFLNPQTWSVITGIAPPDRAERAMQSVREHLLTHYGALLLQPAYAAVDPYIGYITRYAPGLRENGGVYSHASTWAVWAFAKSGDLETAKKIYRGMLPHLRATENADLYAAEPYVMPGNTDGPDSPYSSRAGWTWYTGSASWMVRMAREWLTE